MKAVERFQHVAVKRLQILSTLLFPAGVQLNDRFMVPANRDTPDIYRTGSLMMYRHSATCLSSECDRYLYEYSRCIRTHAIQDRGKPYTPITHLLRTIITLRPTYACKHVCELAHCELTCFILRG